MTNSTESRAVLERLVSEFEQELKENARKGRRTAALMGFLLVFVFGYMTWLYTMLGRLDPEEIAGIASTHLEGMIPDLRQDLREYALHSAPDLTARGRDLLLDSPRLLRGELEDHLALHVHDLAAEAERRMDQYLTETMEDQLTALEQENPGAAPETLLEEYLVRSREGFRLNMEELIDSMYDDYAAEVHRLNEYFARLQANEGLNTDESLHRELIQAWIALVHNHDLLHDIHPGD